MADELFKEIGKTGLQRHSGYVIEEILPELRGERWRRIVREMLANDGVINAMLFAVEMLVRQVSWDVVAASDSERDQENAGFVWDSLNDMSQSWSDTLAEIISFLPWGWCWMELCYKERRGMNPGTYLDSNGEEKQRPTSKYNDGKISWRKWAIRSQDSLLEWDFDDEGGVQGMIQSPPPDYGHYLIPISKSLLFRTSIHKGNPEGVSLLRKVYRSYYFKQRIENIEGIGIERDLAGLPTAFMPSEYMKSTATPTQKEMYSLMKKIVANVKRDENEGLILPSDRDDKGHLHFDLKLLSTGGTRQFDTDKVINRYDQRMLMTFMADFLMLGHEKVGSFALSSNKTDLFAVALGAWLDSIAGVINAHGVPRLMALNGRANDPMPQLVHGDIESTDLEEIGSFISHLSGAGVTLNKQQQNYLFEQARLPIPEEEEKEAEPIAANGAILTAAASVVAQVSRKEMPRDAGIGLLKNLLRVDDATANEIFGSAGLVDLAKEVDAEGKTPKNEAIVEDSNG